MRGAVGVDTKSGEYEGTPIYGSMLVGQASNRAVHHIDIKEVCLAPSGTWHSMFVITSHLVIW